MDAKDRGRIGDDCKGLWPMSHEDVLLIVRAIDILTFSVMTMMCAGIIVWMLFHRR
jgi:hypothetical protein